MDGFAVARQPSLAGHQRARARWPRCRARRGEPVRRACVAARRTWAETSSPPLSDRRVGDAGPDLLDDPGRLVAEQHRHRPDPAAVDDRQIGMAHARGLDAHEKFAGAGRAPGRDRCTASGLDSAYGLGRPICSSTAPRILMAPACRDCETAAMTSSEQSLTSGDFPVHWPVSTRWTDNDMFGHLNNAVYYALFDTAINGWINTNCAIDPLTVPWLGVVAESGCRYFAELTFPGTTFRRVWRSLGWATAASPTGWGSGRRTGPSRPSATGCTCTSTGPPAGLSRSRTRSARCSRRRASS